MILPYFTEKETKAQECLAVCLGGRAKCPELAELAACIRARLPCLSPSGCVTECHRLGGSLHKCSVLADLEPGRLEVEVAAAWVSVPTEAQLGGGHSWCLFFEDSMPMCHPQRRHLSVP